MDKCSELKENIIFLEILEKYKFILKRSIHRTDRAKYEDGKCKLTTEFNEKCNLNLNVKQILRKINNYKFRLREKSYRSTKSKQKPRFSALEKRFLQLWDDSKIECKKQWINKPSKRKRNKCKVTLEEDSDNLYSLSNHSEENQVQKDQIKSEIECDDTKLIPQDECSSSPEEQTHNNLFFDTECEPEIRMEEKEEDRSYENMSIDELKREVLIAQLNMFKANEDSARAKEKLKLYKLWLLEQNNKTT